MKFLIVIVLLILSQVLVAITRPDFTQAKLSSVNGRKRFSLSIGASKKNENLKTLDVDPKIQAISCFKDGQMQILADFDVAPFHLGDVLAGGYEWNCMFEANAPIPFIRKVIEEPILCSASSLNQKETEVDKGRILICLKTDPATLIDAFSELSLSISPMISENQIQVSSSSLVLTSPFVGQSFLTGENLPISWICNNISPVNLSIRTQVFVQKSSNESIFITSNDIPSNNTSTNFTISSNWPPNCLYFIRVLLCSQLENEIQCPQILFDGSTENHFFMVNYIGNVGIISPRSFNVFKPNDVVQLKWLFPSSKSNENIWLKIWAKRALLPDIPITSGQWTKLGNGAIGINWTVPIGCYESDSYYIELQYDCSNSYWCSSVAFSDYFQVRSQTPQKQITLLEPITTADISYRSGGNISISWRSIGFVKGEKLYSISLMRESWGFDRNVEDLALNIEALSENLEITLPYQLPSGTAFYIKIRFNCGIVYCDSVESKRFSINISPFFELLPPTPKRGSIIPDGDPVVIKWFAPRIPSSTPVLVEIRQLWPSWIPIDPPISGKDASIWTTAGIGQVTLHPTSTAFPVYISFSYNCVVGSFWCTTEISPMFYIPIGVFAAWNYNPITGTVINPQISFASTNCIKQCKSSPLSLFCEMCKLGMDVKANGDCFNCYTLAEAQIGGLELEISMSKIARFALQMNGLANFDFSVRGKVDANLDLEVNNELWSMPIFGYRFWVGDVQIVLGVLAFVDQQFDISAKSASVITSELSGTILFSTNISYGGKEEDGLYVNLSFTNLHKPTLDLSAASLVDLMAMLTAGLKAEMTGLVSLTAESQAISQLQIAAQYPPFNLLPNPKLINESLWSFGDCSISPHIVRFGLSAGFRLVAKAEVLPPKGIVFEKTHNLKAIQVISGCLANIKGVKKSSSPAIVEALALDVFSESDLPLGLNLTESALQIEIADLLETAKELILVKLNNIKQRISGLEIVFLPLLDESSSSGPNTIALAHDLRILMSNTSSSFYKGKAGSQLIGKISVVETSDDYSSTSPFLSPIHLLLISFFVSFVNIFFEKITCTQTQI